MVAVPLATAYDGASIPMIVHLAECPQLSTVGTPGSLSPAVPPRLPSLALARLNHRLQMVLVPLYTRVRPCRVDHALSSLAHVTR